MNSISDSGKVAMVKIIVEGDGTYELAGEFDKSHIDDLYNLFTQKIIPKSNETIILRYIGIFYNTVVKDLEKCEEYFLKALENGCRCSAWNLARLYQSQLEKQVLSFHKGKNLNKYIKYMKLSLNADNVNACCALLDSRVDLPPEQIYNITIGYTKNICGSCMFKMAQLLFQQKHYEESLHFCNVWLKNDANKNMCAYNSFVKAIYLLLGNVMVKLELHKKYDKKILRKNKNIRRKLEKVYSKDVGELIMRYYTINWNKNKN